MNTPTPPAVEPLAPPVDPMPPVTTKPIESDYMAIVRANPIPSVVGALVAGLAIGLLISGRSKEEEVAHTFKEWLEDTYEGIASKIPDARKHLPSEREIKRQACALGDKLRFW